MGYSSSLFALLLGSIVLLSRGFFLSARFSAGHRSTALQAVTDIGSTEEFDAALAAAGENVLVVDYSTTWCGPCKFVLPKFEELSEKYDDVVFLKCIGDTSAEASQLMKREGVRSVPAFHIWKAGSKIDTVNGARIDDVEMCIKQNM